MGPKDQNLSEVRSGSDSYGTKRSKAVEVGAGSDSLDPKRSKAVRSQGKFGQLGPL